MERRSPLLSAVDALCDELQTTCGLTRFSLVIDRDPHPLTITFQDELHFAKSAGASAVLQLDLRDGDRCIGQVTLEDALAYTYPDDVRGAAGDVLRRHVGALAQLLPERPPPNPNGCGP